MGDADELGVSCFEGHLDTINAGVRVGVAVCVLVTVEYAEINQAGVTVDVIVFVLDDVCVAVCVFVPVLEAVFVAVLVDVPVRVVVSVDVWVVVID